MPQLTIKLSISPDRAWIRMTLNEQSTQSFFKKFSSQPDIARQYYEDFALLLDEERLNMLAMLFQGMCRCLSKLYISGSHILCFRRP